MEERATILKDFKSGKVSVLVNCAILTEGTDLPRGDCILLAKKTNSEPLFKQMLGRGARLHDEKQDCLVRLFDGVMSTQDELDDAVNDKKRVAKKASAKKSKVKEDQGEAEPEESQYEDGLVTITHYKNLQHFLEKRAANSSKKKEAPAAAAPNLESKDSTNDVFKHLDDMVTTMKSFLKQFK
ncbi:hypothetical protein MBANPS3_009242 [Mucor bainieri]